MFSTARKPAGCNALYFVEIVEFSDAVNALQYPYALGIYVAVLVEEYSHIPPTVYCTLSQGVWHFRYYPKANACEGP